MSVSSPRALDAAWRYYSPSFSVEIDGRELPIAEDVLSVQYSDSIHQLDTASVALNAWDSNRRVFKYLDETFAPGAAMRLSLGYHGDDLVTMLTGEIAEWSTSFPSSGPPVVTVRAINLLQRFRKQQQSRAFFDKTDPEIADAVAQGLKAKVEGREFRRAVDKQPYVLQDNEYDIDFLVRRARERGFEIVVREPDAASGRPVLLYQPSTTPAPVARVLEYGSSLVEFTPKLAVRDQVGSVTVEGWHPTSKRRIRGEAKRSQSDLSAVEPRWLRSAVDRHSSDRKERRNVPGVLTGAHADRIAREILDRNLKSLVTGAGRSVGLPDVRAGANVQLDGIAAFSGRYYVTSTSHQLGQGGYTTSFEARREASGAGGGGT